MEIGRRDKEREYRGGRDRERKREREREREKKKREKRVRENGLEREGGRGER